MGARLSLALVGDGEMRGELHGLVRALGLERVVHFTGFRHDLESVAASTDIAVLSSDSEGTPVSLIEAGAAGKPAVATAVGGVPEIVTPATGVTVPAGDYEAFGAKLATLALRSDLRICAWATRPASTCVTATAPSDS